MGIFLRDFYCTCEICCFDRDFSSAQDKNLLLCSQIARSSAKQASSCSPMSLAPGDWARALFNCRTWVSSRWGRVRRELSDTHLPCTHIWTRCITRRVVASQPSLAAMSTRDYSGKGSCTLGVRNSLLMGIAHSRNWFRLASFPGSPRAWTKARWGLGMRLSLGYFHHILVSSVVMCAWHKV